MAEAPPKLLYIVVVDEGERGGNGNEGVSFRYTRPVLQSTLQLMGCKARHAFKISRRVYEIMRSKRSILESRDDKHSYHDRVGCSNEAEVTYHSPQVETDSPCTLPFELYKRHSTISVTREAFLKIVCDVLSEYKYVGPNQKADLMLACRIRERKESVTILLCGTSGCGKSTLSALLGSRLGITTVVSTDSIRHMMRSFADEKQNPLLWASTYHAGECLDAEAVAKAKAKRRARKLAGFSHSVVRDDLSDGISNERHDDQYGNAGPGPVLIGKKQMAIEGFKAQSEMVIDSLDRLITAWEDRKESVVVEGVHLSLNFVMGLKKKHPSIIPFMVFITSEDKHMERFAVRAKYMTLDPAKNKYIKYIRNIRAIQEYLCNRADKHLVPKINNTNVDRSVAAIHATLFSCLRRREAGEQLYDPTTNTVPIVAEEYKKQCSANTLSSKRMLQLIQRQGSSRHLMALVNTDGSVARAWPVESMDGKGKQIGSENCVGHPMCGPLQIGKAEPINLQFGTYGISAWPSDAGGTSHMGSICDSRGDGTDSGSRHVSSGCSSPRISDGPSKELKEESSVSGSEDADEPPDIDSDEDLSDADNRDTHEEMEGSVDEESTKSDDEYEDLALRDGLENGYSSGDDKPKSEKKYRSEKKPAERYSETRSVGDLEKYNPNVDLLWKTNEPVPGSQYPRTPPTSERKQRRITKRSLSDSARRSQSMSALAKSRSLHRATILPGGVPDCLPTTEEIV